MSTFFKLVIQYRKLIMELAWRDIKLQYRKPTLGFLWMLIMPLSTALIYKVLFSDFMRVESKAYPYFMHLVTALLPWNFFSSAVQRSSRSIIENRGMLHQLAFPKILLPVAAVVSCLINFLPSLVVLAVLLLVFKLHISLFVFFLPVVLAVYFLVAVGIGLMVSAWQVFYRDVEYVIQVGLTVLFFLTPAVYTLEELIGKVSGRMLYVYLANPLVGILTSFRYTLMREAAQTLPAQVTIWNSACLPVISACVLLYAGIVVFTKSEGHFYDYINT